MTRRDLVVVLVTAIVVGALSTRGAIAEPQPAIDRALTERLVRAVEEQARATRELVRATERCKR
jgi:hypothetical protein